ncbi:MAG: helix-turn-helix domain-containing protein, partial [Lachnospiraceae bacterium]|nr:helix-turn-helix domain-containing protein [Lachnospiraceae bacterium]
MNFAENLKAIRKEQGISQEELAEMLDVSRQAVSKWESGNGYPEVEKLLIISEK